MTVTEAVTGVRVLLMDFDGTSYRGDAPILGYARAAARRLGPADGAALVGAARRFLATGEVPAGATGRAPEDGWDAVTLLATGLGAGPDLLRRAFAEARRALTAGRYPIEVPPGLAAVLRRCRDGGRCTVVLASNSPEDSVTPVLGSLGLLGEFDAVVAGADKPGGLLAAARAGNPAVAPGDVLSVGDHYPNDIAPAVAAGAATGYLNPYRLAGRPATFSAPRIEAMYAAMTRWCAGTPVGASDPVLTERSSG